MNIQKIKKFVQDNKPEIAFTVGVIAGTAALAILYRSTLSEAIAGEKWEAIQAFTDTKTGDLILVVQTFNKNLETITIPLKEG